MDEQQYKRELAYIVGKFSHDIVQVVHKRIETYSKENCVCSQCGGEVEWPALQAHDGMALAVIKILVYGKNEKP